MQAKDIPERPLLEWLAARPQDQYGRRPAFIWSTTGHEEDSVLCAMPAGTPEKVAKAKMAALIKRGLVDGCACGCRGDFRINEQGEAACGPRQH